MFKNETVTKLAKSGAALNALGIAIDLMRLVMGGKLEPLLLNIGFMSAMLVIFLLIAR